MPREDGSDPGSERLPLIWKKLDKNCRKVLNDLNRNTTKLVRYMMRELDHFAGDWRLKGPPRPVYEAPFLKKRDGAFCFHEN